MIAPLLLVWVIGAVEPPKTVNGIALGTEEQFTTAGPARICIRNLMVTARAGESVSLHYAGIHNGVLRLNRGKSWVDAALGENWAQPLQKGDVIERRPRSYIADVSTETKLRYGLFAYDKFYERYHLQVWIEGPALTGEAGDRSILRRIELHSDSPPACDVSYNFGWPMLFGEEPVVEPKK